MWVVKTWYSGVLLQTCIHSSAQSQCNIEYLLRYSSKGTVDSVPLASVHYLHCEVFSNVCMSERECGARQQR